MTELISHLIELRQRLLYCVMALSLVFLICCFYSNALFTLLAEPLLAQVKGDTALIATGIATPFIIPLKLSFIVAVALCVPILLYHAWAFISPGLYQHEQRLAWSLLFSSIVLFYLGVLFAYEVVFPLIFGFFTSTAPAHVTFMPDISHYLDFCLQLFLAFGITFEIPIAVLLLVRTGLTSVETLTRYRPYFIVIAFTVGMVLTPPDVLSQCLLAVPMCALFELGLLFARVISTKQ